MTAAIRLCPAILAVALAASLVGCVQRSPRTAVPPPAETPNGAPASGQAPGTTQVIPGVPGTESLGPLSAPEKKLDAALIAISRAHAAGGNARARVAAKTELVTVERDRARVEVTCASNAAVANVRALIVRRGGAVLSTFENKAFAWVPFGAVARLASDERVWSLAVSRQAFGPAGTPTP